MSAATCETCRYWYREPYSPECRRRSPLCAPPAPGTYRSGSADRAFPLTDARDWCGEHEPWPTQQEAR